MSPILTLENDYLKLDLNSDCSGTIIDKKQDITWDIGPVAWQDVSRITGDIVWNRGERYWADYYICRFKADKAGDRLRVKVLGPPWDDARGEFTAEWKLDGNSIELRVSDISESIPSLNYPAPIRSKALVIPKGVGSLITDDTSGMTCEFSTQNNGLNMRWVGGLDEKHRNGWMMVFEDNYAYSGVYRNGLSITPCWLQCKNKWLDSYSVRYHLTENGYVGQAKKFRKYMLDNKLFRTLEEKVEETPALKNLLGGRIVSFQQCHTDHPQNKEDFFRSVSEKEKKEGGKLNVRVTHKDGAEIIRLAKSWGMERGLFNIRGTFPGGYDDSHPDIWPPEPALGTIDELKGLMNQEDPYLAVLHDNYQDMYKRVKSFPEGLVKTADGNYLWGGYWHGGLCFIICSKKQVEYARRNWEDLKTLGLRGHFIDTAACVQFYECYDPDHPMTRDEDGPAKQELMKFFKDQGQVLGSEEAADYGLYHIDFLENRHSHKPNVTPPIWPLVFHDAAFYARYSTGGTSGGAPASQLENWLWGYMCYWPVNNLKDWRKQEQKFKETLSLDSFHANVGMDEMIDHQYIDDGLIEQTVFSSGISVIANFSDEIRTVGGHEIEAGGHLVQA